MKITLAIGSNILQQKNIDEARSRLRHLLPGIVFGEAVWTTPIGIQSDRFLNLLAYADTPLSLDHLQEALKAIEREMGDSHENHQQGHVIIDLDVAEYDGRTIKEVVWIKEVQQAQNKLLAILVNKRRRPTVSNKNKQKQYKQAKATNKQK